MLFTFTWHVVTLNPKPQTLKHCTPNPETLNLGRAGMKPGFDSEADIEAQIKSSHELITKIQRMLMARRSVVPCEMLPENAFSAHGDNANRPW